MAYTTIKKPSDYFNTKLYSGTGSTQNITGVGFQPDLVWIKGRNNGNYHRWFDAVRGVPNYIGSNATDAEASDATQFTSFDSDGFTLSTGGATNGSGYTFASWNWLASNTTASNTDGSITSTVSANTTSGFSIVSYTGTGANATVGHGLGSTPSMIIFKNRIDLDNWIVGHIGMTWSNKINLNNASAQGTASSHWNNTAPTSSVFTVNTDSATNGSGDGMIAYCFAEKKGFSKFGKYTGNGNADGTFVYTGFKPAMVILKDYTSASNYNWIILDNKRDPSNGLDRRLQPSSSFAEYTDVSDFCDFTSNGFKWRGSQANWNGSGVGYIYMAFAEQPLVGDNPATAR